MDVGMMLIFSSYGWEEGSDGQMWDEELRLAEVAADLGFDPRQCFVVGDKSSDIELGRRVGATTFLVRTGYGAQVSREGLARAHYTVDGLSEAAEVVRGLHGSARVRPPS